MLDELAPGEAIADGPRPGRARYLPEARLEDVAESHRAFAVAEKILTDFLKTHEKLAFAERIEYLIVQNAIARATAAFADRKDKTSPPKVLSEESEAALVALTGFLKVWQPKRIFRFDTAENTTSQATGAKAPAAAKPQAGAAAPLTAGAIVKAWSPFIILTAMVTLWSLKPFKALFAAGGPLASTIINIPVPMLDKLVAKMPPVVAQATPYGAVYTFNWLAATGTAILIAAILTIAFARFSPAKAVATLGETVRELVIPIYSIGMVLAFAFVANYSGLSATLALALAHTGQAFVFFSPFLGWIGVFLTGSDTSANALFGALQATTANQLGLSPVLTVAANTTGGVTGKMISPQSIAIACAAVGLAGKESDLFRFTVKHSLVFAAIIGIICTLQAYVFTWMIPGH